MQQPNTWDELLEAGYVVELNEEQIGLLKARLRPERSEQHTTCPDEQSMRNHERERIMREKAGKR